MQFLINTIKTIKTKLWNTRLDKERPLVATIIKTIRIAVLSWKKFIADKCLTQASALTYFTFFSIVPLVALAFAIAKGFGLEKELERNIIEKNPQYSFLLENIFQYANAMLKATKGGVIAGAGVFLLLYSVISLLNNVESVFNQICEAQKPRNWYRKIADYVAIMIFAPLFLIFSSSITILLETKISALLFSNAAVIGIRLLSFVLLMLVFFALYETLTNAFISVKSAMTGAFVAALLFELLEWAYIHFQIGVSRFNAIYGSLAALPLFLIFVQYSWYILLFGAEWVYVHQHFNKFEFEREITHLSMKMRKVFSIMILSKLLNHFIQKNKGIKASEISEQLDIPIRLTQTILNDLIDVNFIIEVKQENDDPVYLPLKPDYQITVSELVKALDSKGTNQLPVDASQEFLNASQTIEKIETILHQNFCNILVKDI